MEFTLVDERGIYRRERQDALGPNCDLMAARDESSAVELNVVVARGSWSEPEPACQMVSRIAPVIEEQIAKRPSA